MNNEVLIERLAAEAAEAKQARQAVLIILDGLKVRGINSVTFNYSGIEGDITVDDVTIDKYKRDRHQGSLSLTDQEVEILENQLDEVLQIGLEEEYPEGGFVTFYTNGRVAVQNYYQQCTNVSLTPYTVDLNQDSDFESLWGKEIDGVEE